MKQRNWSIFVWDIAYPILLYYAVMVIAMFLAGVFLGTETDRYMLRNIIATLVVLPVLYINFYKPDVLLSSNLKWKEMDAKTKSVNAVAIMGIILFIGFGLNNIILMSPLVEWSEAFAEANDNFYGSTVILEIIGAGMLTPVLEELLHRGIVYTRIKRRLGVTPAIVLSALFFALLHFNVVQFLYSFCLGIVLAMFVEKTGHVSGAILGHMTINIFSILRTEWGIFDGTLDKSILSWVISVTALLVGIVFLLMYWRKEWK